ncbi:MAG: glucosamine-6-phosphate deaminase [Opitutaceae bacterium]|nr:glucosamine-6-phosphate deaminase [Cephaloticoccus sp.]MCP5530425.1 glucosamine-6-phosphate deaminase [Opitutaceae bacterium]
MLSSIHPSQRLRVESLTVEIYSDNQSMGRAAATQISQVIRRIAAEQDYVRLILGSANSQLSFVQSLVSEHELPWERMICFHMDEYLGISPNHPASFRHWMTEHLIRTAHPRAFHLLAGDVDDPRQEIYRYTNLLHEHPIDITVLGFGENGHLAFNDPPHADFEDPETVRIVTLDQQSRQQQVGEGHFPAIDAVPTQALTLTIPTLLSASYLFGVVPEKRKATAVHAALYGPLTPKCPASILRSRTNAKLYLDADSASELN